MNKVYTEHERPKIYLYGNGMLDVSSDYPDLDITTLTYRMSMPKLKKSITNVPHLNGSSVNSYSGRVTFEDRTLEVDYICESQNREEAVTNINAFLFYTGHRKGRNRFSQTFIKVPKVTMGYFTGYPDDVVIEQVFGGVFKFTLSWVVYPLAKTDRSSREMYDDGRGRGMEWNDLYFGKTYGKRQILVPAFELTEKDQVFEFLVPNPAPVAITFYVFRGNATFKLNSGPEHQLNVWIEEANTYTNSYIELSEIILFQDEDWDGYIQKNKLVARGSGVLMMEYTFEELLYV